LPTLRVGAKQSATSVLEIFDQRPRPTEVFFERGKYDRVEAWRKGCRERSYGFERRGTWIIA